MSTREISKPIDVGLLGATGMVGQEFVAELESHPWFNLTWLGASQRSEGRRYADAARWRLPTIRPAAVGEMVVDSVTPGRAPRLVFSGLDAEVAGEVEAAFAEAGHIVVSNARNYRMEPDVPLVVPEINPDHLRLLSQQGEVRKWSGRIVTNPNCSTIVLSMALAPLRQFGLRSVNVTTLQAVSGAGYPGVASLDIVGNVIPFIAGEEAVVALVVDDHDVTDDTGLVAVRGAVVEHDRGHQLGIGRIRDVDDAGAEAFLVG